MAKSIYDSISTAEDLVNEVMFHGLSLKQEDICRAQDIFGHSPIEELDRLANDIGRDNDNWEPDPNGIWSSGRRGTRSAFYQIAFNIWSWEDATRFWLHHSCQEYKELGRFMNELAEAREDMEKLAEKLRDEIDEHQTTKKLLHQAKLEAEQNLKAVYEERNEKIRLKAELYDYISRFGVIGNE